MTGDAFEFEDGHAIADFFQARLAQIITQLGVAREDDRQRAAAIGNDLHQAFQALQGIGVEIVRLVDNEGDRPALLAHQFAQFAFALFAVLGDLDLLFGGQVVEQRLDQGGERRALLIDGE
jgi:hypothetical protein